MNIDRQYRIRIDLTADASGGKVATAALEETGKAAEKAGGHFHEMHHLVHGLNEIVPGLGLAMQAAFSPMGATVGMAVMALRLFNEAAKANDVELQKLAEEAARPLTRRLESLRDSVVSTATGLAGLDARLAEASRAEESIGKATEQATSAIKQQFGIFGSLADATQEYELAKLKEAHAAGLTSEDEYARRRIEIEIAFANKKRKIQEGEEMAEILARRRAIEDAEADRGRLTAAAVTAEEKKEKALTALASLTPRTEIEKRHEDTQKALKDFQNGRSANAQFFEGLGLNATPEQAYQAAARAAYPTQGTAYEFTKGTNIMAIGEEYQKWVGLKQAANDSQAEWVGAPVAEARRKVAADAATREADHAARLAEENDRFITEQSRENERASSQFNARKSANTEIASYQNATRWMEAGISPPDPRAMLTGALSSYAGSGYDPNALQQAAAEIAAKLGARDSVVLNMLRTLINNSNYLDSDVRILQSQMRNYTSVGGGQ
jgi:hypothetical protein